MLKIGVDVLAEAVEALAHVCAFPCHVVALRRAAAVAL